MGKLADSMIENGITKRSLYNGGGMCLVGHAATVFLSSISVTEEVEEWVEDLQEDGYDDGYYDTSYIEREYPIFDYLKKLADDELDETEEIWERIPQSYRAVILQVVEEESGSPCAPWNFNDSELTSDDDILRVGKLVDEKLNELGLE